MESQSDDVVVNHVVARLALEKSKVIEEIRKPVSRLYARAAFFLGFLFVNFLVLAPFQGGARVLVLTSLFLLFVGCLIQIIEKLSKRVEALSSLLLEQQDR